jgi:hypothetical protein
MARCPKTAAEAWKRLDKRLSEEDKKAIREAEDMVDFYFSLCMWIRNYWIYTGERENLESLMKDWGNLSSLWVIWHHQPSLKPIKNI